MRGQEEMWCVLYPSLEHWVVHGNEASTGGIAVATALTCRSELQCRHVDVGSSASARHDGLHDRNRRYS